MGNIMDLFRQIEQERSSVGGISYMIVGLGNPGREYEETRHNVGFRFIDSFADRNGARIDRAKFQALTADVTYAGKRILLLKPQTYMNSSGLAVREAAAFYKIPVERILVIYDDISLEPGRVRIRKKGSDGEFSGGPMQYLSEGIGRDLKGKGGSFLRGFGKVLGVMAAVFCVLAAILPFKNS